MVIDLSTSRHLRIWELVFSLVLWFQNDDLSSWSLFYFCSYKAEWTLQVILRCQEREDQGTYAWAIHCPLGSLVSDKKPGSSAWWPRGLRAGLLSYFTLMHYAAGSGLYKHVCACVFCYNLCLLRSRTRVLLKQVCFPSSVFILATFSARTCSGV